MQEFETWLQGEDRSTVCSYRQVTKVVTPDATPKVTTPAIHKPNSASTRNTSFADTDIEVLRGHYGELFPGMTIIIELNKACELLGRTRKRIDAFKKLQDYLMEQYKVELVITSRKTKNGKD